MGTQRDTRTRIQDVAIRLFTEQGYEATSLREIAEALGVTKAALYYHFKSKEDIIASLIEDHAQALDELIDWTRRQPATPQTRQEVIRRYAAKMTDGRHHEVMRLMQRNQAALHGMRKPELIRKRMQELIDVLSAPDDPLAIRLRRSMALFALHAVWFSPPEDDLTPRQRMEAALEVALELADAADRVRRHDG
ncbi:TetR/AcrR family transcriptional regulator [Sphaerimonospora sp. CA-214678]|uniref:TetR/AcrR family transcriptional regulator n=1 Tax=Sphaerimonospora sp. CA-214678 TaxID=3240029 RepID=UPI003D8DE32A